MQISRQLSLRNFQVWRSQRKLLALARWDLIRAKGQTRFVLRQALTYSLIMIPARDFSDYLIDGQMQPWSERFLVNSVSYCIAGLLIGFFSWASMEGRYKNALLDQQIAAGEINPPH